MSGCGVVVVDDRRDVVVADCGTQGPPGPDPEAIEVTAGETIPAWRAVRVDPDGLAYLADNDTPTDGLRLLGISRIAALVGEPLTVATDGTSVDTTPTTWTPGPLYVGEAGVLVSTPPDGAVDNYTLTVACALTTTRLIVRPQFPIYLVP